MQETYYVQKLFPESVPPSRPPLIVLAAKTLRK